MPRLDPVPGPVPHPLDDRPEITQRNLGRGATSAADDVVVGLVVGEVVHRRTVTQMRVHHHTGVFEGVQGAVDGRLVGPALQSFDDLAGREMLAVIRSDHLTDGAPGSGGAQAGSP